MASPGLRPILVADGDEGARSLICACFDALGLVNPRMFVGDGDAAVEQLTLCAGAAKQVPALVLLDGLLAGRNGLEVLRWMRAQPSLDSVPVIMLNTTADVHAVRDAYDNGAASYLVKPVAFEALGDVVRSLAMPWTLL